MIRNGTSEATYIKLVPLLHEIKIPGSPVSFERASAQYNAAKIREAQNTIGALVDKDTFSIVYQYMGSAIFIDPTKFLDLIFSLRASTKDFLELSEHVKKHIITSLYNAILKAYKSYTFTKSSGAIEITENTEAETTVSSASPLALPPASAPNTTESELTGDT